MVKFLLTEFWRNIYCDFTFIYFCDILFFRAGKNDKNPMEGSILSTIETEPLSGTIHVHKGEW